MACLFLGLQSLAKAGQCFPAVNYEVGEHPITLAIGDFDRDGILDLAVANFRVGNGPGTIRILIGQRDGTFREGALFASGGSEPTSVAVGDFNHDGKLDLAVTNSEGAGGSGPSNLSVFLGDGNGTFGRPVKHLVGTLPKSIATGDFNADGNLDLAVGTFADVTVLIGKGDGTFGIGVNYAADLVPVSIAVDDFNGDGKLDLAVANQDSDDVSILLGTGRGTFEAAVNYPAGPSPASVAVGDFNRDGKLDLVVADQGCCAGTTVGVLPGNGDGTFQKPESYPAGADPVSVAVADFNRDGKLDLVVADLGGLFGTTVSLLLGNGDGSFQTPVAYTVGTGPSFVAVGNLNRNGAPDVAVANDESNNVSVLLNVGFP